eukprot:scaffold48979_cov29-Tisochrysis_lutea.AAC.6
MESALAKEYELNETNNGESALNDGARGPSIALPSIPRLHVAFFAEPCPGLHLSVLALLRASV